MGLTNVPAGAFAGQRWRDDHARLRRTRVVLAARSEQSLQEVAGECEAAGGWALAVPTDVTNEEAGRELAHRSVEGFGG